MGHASHLFISSFQNHLACFPRSCSLDSFLLEQHPWTAAESTGRLPEKYPSAGPALPENAAPPCAASSPADGRFHYAYSLADTILAISLYSNDPVLQPARHIVYKNHRVFKRAGVIRSDPGSEKLPAQQRRQPPYFHREAADIALTNPECAPDTTISRDRCPGCKDLVAAAPCQNSEVTAPG